MPDVNSGMFDAVLRQAVKDDLNNELEAIPSDDDIKKMYTFSDEHNRRVKKLFVADERRGMFKNVSRLGLVAVFALITCISLVTNPNINPFFKDEKTSANAVINRVKPSYVPDGYEMAQSYNYANRAISIGYKDNNGNEIIIGINDEYGSGNEPQHIMQRDVPNPNLHMVFINGKEGVLFDNGEFKLLTWTGVNGFRYSIDAGRASIETEELIKIAESIEIFDINEPLDKSS